MQKSGEKGPDVLSIVLQHSDIPSAWHFSVLEYLSLYGILCNPFKRPNMSKEGLNNVFPSKTCWITCYTHHSLMWIRVSQKISARRSKHKGFAAEPIDFTLCCAAFGTRIFILFKTKALCHVMLLKILIMIT